MIRTALLATALFVVMLVAGAALGAPSDEQTLDLTKIRAEAAKYAQEAEALAAIVRTRAEGARDEAQTTRAQAEANVRQYVEADATREPESHAHRSTQGRRSCRVPGVPRE